MTQRFLVTTADERTWPEDLAILFLGEWCCLYSRKEVWQNLDAEVLPYHWDDRAKFYTDYKYLQEFNERLLANLAAQLNHIHGVDHSLRYWRVLIKPWLDVFIYILFDRWVSIQQVVNRYDLSGTIVLTGEKTKLIPNCMAEFTRFFVGDEWNHNIYAAILQQYTRVPCIERTRQSRKNEPKAAIDTLKKKVKRVLMGSYTRVSGLLTTDQDVFFLNTYLPLLDEVTISMRLGKIPQLWSRVSPVQVAADEGRRQWVVEGESRNEFEACARNLIPRQIPSVYLEGYRQLVDQTKNLCWPKQPKLIWTSNAHYSDDVFKAWAGEKIENGSPLVIGQHGGNYGIGRWSFIEEHEINISDCYFSWGWSEPEQSKVKPVGQLISKRPYKVQHAEQKGALLVTCALSRFSDLMYSVFISRQWIDYFNDQCAFVESLPESIRNSLTVRLFSQDYGWDQMARWRDRFPDLHLDDGRSDINELIQQNKLYIATYNGTTFLETFTMNVPTVIYWNPHYWELRDTAIPYFEGLKRVGIFHDTPESAAHHVATIWDNVEAWWNSPAVRKELDIFKLRYCNLPKNRLDIIENALREVITVSEKKEEFLKCVDS